MSQSDLSQLGLLSVSLDVLFTEKRTPILKEASFRVPRGVSALVAERREEQVALIDLFSRVILPQTGHVEYRGSVSWPIGQLGPFSVATTGTHVVSHIATLYGIDRQAALNFLDGEFEAPHVISTRMAGWPRLLRTKFLLLMALVVPFDIYLVDGNLILPEDPAFTRRFLYLFLKRIQDKTVIMTVRQARFAQTICQGAIVLQDMKLHYSTDLETALRLNNRKPHIQANPEDMVEPESDGDFLF